jgi:glycosyltransferase involved in cell wall biosynthesis
MWRNHSYGNLFTRISVLLSDKVLCTSKFAFVAKYKKTILMPVGIDTNKFIKFESSKVHKVKNSILFLGRMNPIKKPDLLIEALLILGKKGVAFRADFYGDSLPKDQDYYNSLKNRVAEMGLNKQINFYKSVPNYETPKIYNAYEIFVNLTPSGSFDKTILEAAACGCLLVITNKSLSGDIDERMIMKSEDVKDIAEGIDFWLNVSNEEKVKISEKLQKYVLEKHRLGFLVEKLVSIMYENSD